MNCDLLFSPTKGKDHVNTSIKLGSQYGCGVQLNCLIFMTLFSYFRTAAINEIIINFNSNTLR
jgi:hypothetical protein